jgi:hypothetical protein
VALIRVVYPQDKGKWRLLAFSCWYFICFSSTVDIELQSVDYIGWAEIFNLFHNPSVLKFIKQKNKIELIGIVISLLISM